MGTIATIANCGAVLPGISFYSSQIRQELRGVDVVKPIHDERGKVMSLENVSDAAHQVREQARVPWSLVERSL